MAAIYDKALKRKDFSGIVNKDVKAEDAKEPMVNGPNRASFDNLR